MFTVAYSLRFIRDVFFGPAPTDLPRMPHEPPFLMRFPAELLVLACLVVGIAPAATVGPILDTAVRAVLGAATPEYNLAVWHGFTPELLMSIVAMTGGVAVYVMLRSYLVTSDGPPLLRHLNGQRIFDRVLVTLSGDWPAGSRTISARGVFSHSCSSWCARLFVAALTPLYARGLVVEGSPHGDLDLAFALLWAVGIACALGAAYKAKFHRLAALILLGGAGLVTCISFVWLSAPDLALTQLVVETVTTVLLLLGLRWLPKRIEGIGPAERTRHDTMVSPPPLHDRGWRRSGAGDACIRGNDPAAARQHFAVFCGERLHGRRRRQHRERHSGRLPRLRYPGRDHGARGCRLDRLRPVAAVPPGPRKHPGSRTAARPERL